MTVAHKFVDPAAAAYIESQLAAIARDHDVRILFAIESGSRGWGFPSPDSDYDVRFVYAMPRDRYLTLYPERDVIELPLIDDWDINGWDLRKALALMLKPNPVLLEWLDSPIRYLWDSDACEALRDLSVQVDHRTACLHHYLKDGRVKWPQSVGRDGKISLKKYFYALRSALALRWLRLNPKAVPPMTFDGLRAGVDLDAALSRRLDELLARKLEAKEAGPGLRLSDIDEFLEAEFAWARTATTEKTRAQPDLIDKANSVFRRLIE